MARTTITLLGTTDDAGHRFATIRVAYTYNLEGMKNYSRDYTHLYPDSGVKICGQEITAVDATSMTIGGSRIAIGEDFHIDY